MRSLLSDSLIRRFLGGGSLGAVKLATGLVRVKILAILLGAAGVGVLAQAAQFTLVAIALTSVSMAVGIINRTRDERLRARHGSDRLTLGTALVTLLVFSACYMVAAMVCRPFIAAKIFQGTLSESQLLPVLLGVPFAVLSSGYMEGLFYSRDRFDLYVKAGSVASVMELLLYTGGAWLGGISGVLMAVGMSSVTLLASYLWHLRQLHEGWRALFPLTFEWAEAQALLRYAVVMLMTAALGYVSVLYVRAEVLGEYGPKANGLLQVALALSAYSLPFVTNGVWGYLHPLASKLGDTPETKQELLRVLRMVAILSSLGSVAVLSVPELLIKIAYTGDFSEAAAYFPAQFLGDYFYFFAFAVGVFFLATSKLKVYVMGWVAYYAIYLVLARALLPTWGPGAPTVGHCVASCTLGVVAASWLITRLRPRWRDMALFSVGAVIVLTAAIFLHAGVSPWVRWALLAATLVGYGVIGVRAGFSTKSTVSEC